MTRFNRRTFLKATGGAFAVTALPLAALSTWVYMTSDTSNRETVRFEAPLHIPPLIDQQGDVPIDLELREGRTELLPGKPADTWGINGDYLGPTIRTRPGATLSIDVHNHLPETTSMHWHGAELPAVADGGPHQPIDPGATWTATFSVEQPPATLWYHPHPHGATAKHVYRGLSGLLIIADDEQSLPHTYGVDDIPLIIQDRKFADDGALTMDDDDWVTGGSMVGVLGSDILVNGTWGPTQRITSELTRFRLLNGSNARIYNLRFDPDKPFHVISTDSGFLPEPVEVDGYRLSPGERVEIVARFEPGERSRLVSSDVDLGAFFVVERLAGGDDTFDLVEFHAADALEPAPDLPETLPARPPVATTADTTRREFELGDFNTINGKAMDMQRIDLVVPSGQTETWVVRNGSMNPHNFHIHNASFSIVEVDGGPVGPEFAGRKDTVYCPPGSSVTLAVEFGQYTDETYPYMAHCHLLIHEDTGMMMQFLMVEPGREDEVDLRIASPHHHE